MTEKREPEVQVRLGMVGDTCSNCIMLRTKVSGHWNERTIHCALYGPDDSLKQRTVYSPLKRHPRCLEVHGDGSP